MAETPRHADQSAMRREASGSIESKHTPGPWCYDKATEAVCAGLTPDSEYVIGRFEPASGPLAASAPDCYAANVAFMSAVIHEHDLFGKSDGYIYDTIGSALARAFFMARDAIAKATAA